MSIQYFDNLQSSAKFENEGTQLKAFRTNAIGAITVSGTIATADFKDYDILTYTVASSGLSADITLTLDTAANIVSGFNGSLSVNDTINFIVSSVNSNASYEVNFAAGTGGTLIGQNHLLENVSKCATIKIVMTNVTSGSEAYTVYIN